MLNSKAIKQLIKAQQLITGYIDLEKQLQPAGFDLGRRVDARRDAVRQEAEKLRLERGVRRLEETADLLGLGRIQRQRRKSQGPSLCGALLVVLQHGLFSWSAGIGRPSLV